MWLLTVTVISYSMLGSPSIQSQTLIETTQQNCESLAIYVTQINSAKNDPGTSHKTIAKCEKEK